jgi:hypothetical protein
MMSLEHIEVPGRGRFEALNFWERFDKGEFKK